MSAVYAKARDGGFMTLTNRGSPVDFAFCKIAITGDATASAATVT